MLPMNGPPAVCEDMDIDHSISAGIPSRTLRATCPDVHRSNSLLDGIRFILYNNPYQRNIATLSELQEEAFTVIEKLRVCPQTMFKCLHNHFAEHFGIYLYIIAFDNGKYSLMNKINDEKKYTAFIAFNQDHSIRGSLFNKNLYGTTKTVFTRSDLDIIIDVYMYINQLNDITSSSGSPQVQEQQAVYCEQDLRENLSTNNNPALANQFIESILDIKTRSRFVLDQTLEQVFRTINSLPLDPRLVCQTLQPLVSHIIACKELPPMDAIGILKDVINRLCHLVQLAEQTVSAYQNEQTNMPQPQLPGDQNHQTVEVQIETNETPCNTVGTVGIYPAPKPVELFEKTNHPRTLGEFLNKAVSSPVNCVGLNQRDLIEIGVPPPDGTTLHLDMEMLDRDDETHLLKILVPHGTRVENELLMNNNNLGCLNFDNCDETYKFDGATKHLYSEITAAERQNLRKDIRIHMLKLYQRGDITKQIIRDKDLRKCRLAFSFCLFENGKYKRASPIYYSNVIEDSIQSTKKKETVKKRPNRRPIRIK